MLALLFILAQSPKVAEVSIGAFLAAEVADSYTTAHAVYLEDARELNPVVNKVVQSPVKFIVVKEISTITGAVIFYKLKDKHPRIVFVLSSISATALSFAAYNNSKIRGMR